MIARPRISILLLLVLPLTLFMASLASPVANAQTISLDRGINFGNMLEAPYEGAWGIRAEEAYFDRTVEAGFDHVRLPIAWTYHASDTYPYTIDETFFSRVDELVEQATSRGLKIIVNVHHYPELNEMPLFEWNRALAIWTQIAARYQNASNDLVAFEILNEPQGEFTAFPELWNEYMKEALAIIRETNPVRTVLAGPVDFNSFRSLPSFDPPFDPNLMVTVHYYEPFAFTHQGAHWVTPSPPTGVNWSPYAKVIGGGWQNWSWDTSALSRTGGIKVKWNEGWAGFRLHNDNGTADATEIVFSCNRAETIRVKALRSDGTGEEVVVNTKPGYHFYSVPIFGTPGLPITDVSFENSTPFPRPEFTIRHLGLPANGSFNRMIITGTSAILEDMQAVADWGQANGFSMHVGEFGAFERGNITYRTNWTRTVRAHAERVGLGWAYWEFGSGFGVYDPAESKWKTILIKALLPGFNP